MTVSALDRLKSGEQNFDVVESYTRALRAQHTPGEGVVTCGHGRPALRRWGLAGGVALALAAVGGVALRRLSREGAS